MIKIRLSGSPADISRAARAIAGALNIRRESDLYPNRNGAGSRLYIDADLMAEPKACFCCGTLQPGPRGWWCPDCQTYDPDADGQRLASSITELEALAERNRAAGHTAAAAAAMAKATELQATLDAWSVETQQAVESRRGSGIDASADVAAALERVRERYWVERRLDERYELVGVGFDEVAADLLAELGNSERVFNSDKRTNAK